jgi:hypothetical protein
LGRGDVERKGRRGVKGKGEGRRVETQIDWLTDFG